MDKTKAKGLKELSSRRSIHQVTNREDISIHSIQNSPIDHIFPHIYPPATPKTSPAEHCPREYEGDGLSGHGGHGESVINFYCYPEMSIKYYFY